ncbi:hypothetical protein PCASD_00251 [Puccinia coronata f. sp. avenae]|uniref:Uncharacterized protein n=1 Tax=Puccinia coronata f. sp. avenae TaxID=200324 RepID=A0A2N5VQW1_9BASI|nr:hypothetical protein PCASD_00251 [Puccinia coronata f. sp. avenae]
MSDQPTTDQSSTSNIKGKKPGVIPMTPPPATPYSINLTGHPALKLSNTIEKLKAPGPDSNYLNWSWILDMHFNTTVRAVLEQPCSTGGRTGTVRPKQEPTGRTDLSDRSRLVLCDRSQELIGQACPTRRQVLRSDSACPTTGRTRLFEHRSNCRVRPVNAGSATYAQDNGAVCSVIAQTTDPANI